MGEAFCILLFGKNGGRFTDTGMPIFEKEAKGTCYRGYDCGDCTILHAWAESLKANNWELSWECDKCLRESVHEKDNESRERIATGYYQSGKAGLPQEDMDYDQDNPWLAGCTKCGWKSSFLQLVIRRTK